MEGAMAAPMEHQQAMLREIETLEVALAKLRGVVMQSMIAAGEPRTMSEVRGIPCTADVVWDEREEPVGEVEPVKSSAMIPPRELNRIERGGE